jgi:CHAT domain-containing protein
MRDAASELGIVQWAWRAAGVPALILPRWISDQAARDAFLLELHRHLRAGEQIDAAALAARRSVKSTDGWSAPFYWSGWVSIGGGRQ